MNSVGLGSLVGAMTTLRVAGGDLRIAGVKDTMKNLFVATDIISLVKTFGTAEEAVASFAE